MLLANSQVYINLCYKCKFQSIFKVVIWISLKVRETNLHLHAQNLRQITSHVGLIAAFFK